MPRESMSEQQVPQAWLMDQNGRRIELARHLTVGRAIANSLVLNDAEQRVSQFHARLDRGADGRFSLEDRHSTNGTFVNDRKITRVPLAHGDRIRFGSRAVYTFQSPELAVTTAVAGNFDATARAYEEGEFWFVIGDVKGSSDLARTLAGPIFARLMTEWAAHCRDLMEPHGGVMVNRTGDGWLTLWAAEPPEAARKLALAIIALRGLQKSGKPPFRVLIHRGRATLGGGVLAGEENVLSAELHQAFRMEKIAAKLNQEVVASAVAVPELQAVLPCVLVPGEFELPGFPGKHQFFRVG
jgi:class 3 adenylate cyclase